MVERDPSDSAILDQRFPGYSWMPRWTRKYWTPQTALTLGLAIFSAGSWVGTYLTAPNVRTLTDNVAEIKYVMSPACVRDCVVRTGDIAELKTHVNDLWGMRVDIDAELARQQLLKAKTKKGVQR
jgi:hypothetical protein